MEMGRFTAGQRRVLAALGFHHRSLSSAGVLLLGDEAELFHFLLCPAPGSQSPPWPCPGAAGAASAPSPAPGHSLARSLRVSSPPSASSRDPVPRCVGVSPWHRVGFALSDPTSSSLPFLTPQNEVHQVGDGPKQNFSFHGWKKAARCTLGSAGNGIFTSL